MIEDPMPSMLVRIEAKTKTEGSFDSNGPHVPEERGVGVVQGMLHMWGNFLKLNLHGRMNYELDVIPLLPSFLNVFPRRRDVKVLPNMLIHKVINKYEAC